MAATTWNPADKGASIVLSNGNLTAAWPGGAGAWVRAAFGATTGKYYWEINADAWTNTNTSAGIALSTNNLVNGIAAAGAGVGTSGLGFGGVVYVDGASAGISFGTITSGHLMCYALDCDAGRVWFKNSAAGNWNNSGTANPATGTGGVTLTQFGAGKALYPAFGPWGTNDKMTANFGQNAFTGVVPSGFTQGFGTGLPIAGGGVTSRVMILA